MKFKEYLREENLNEGMKYNTKKLKFNGNYKSKQIPIGLFLRKTEDYVQSVSDKKELEDLKNAVSGWKNKSGAETVVFYDDEEIIPLWN